MKILKQLQEIHISEEFFVIDSKTLESVKTQLYGFIVQKDGIYENENIKSINVDNFDGTGVFTYVKKNANQINIKQDFNGSFGLYLYKKDNYFAISNSLFKLIEYLTPNFSLTLNEEYAYHMLTMDLCSHVYKRTMIQEIEVLDKDVEVCIDIPSKTITTKTINYEEKEYAIDTKKGLQILDEWQQKWTSIFNQIQVKTTQLNFDLSGGFDSRLICMLALCSGVNLSDVYVNSINDTLHTHAEDYKIASNIAKYYGFTLNKEKQINTRYNLNLKDILNIYFYTRFSSHKEWSNSYNHYLYKPRMKEYYFSGAGGETIRSYWQFTPKEFIERYLVRANRYSKVAFKKVKEETIKILEKSFDEIQKNTDDYESNWDIVLELYRHTRSCFHFGSGAVGNYLVNHYELQPLLDPLLAKLKLNTEGCSDRNLLFAVILKRYCPTLLDFPFEGNRSIDQETLRYAEEINRKFPIENTTIESKNSFSLKPYDNSLIYLFNKQQVLNEEEVERSISDIVLRKQFKDEFVKYLDESIYDASLLNYETVEFYPLRDFYTLLAIVVIIDIISHKKTDTPIELISKYAIGDYVNRREITDKFMSLEQKQVFNKVRTTFTSRIDLLLKDENAAFDYSLSDEEANIKEPEWLQKSGKGIIIESYALSMDIVIKPKTEGQLEISLRGIDVSDGNGGRIPYWIDYSVFTINGESMLDQLTPAWHNNIVLKTVEAHENEEIQIHVEWKPHIDNRMEMES